MQSSLFTVKTGDVCNTINCASTASLAEPIPGNKPCLSDGLNWVGYRNGCSVEPCTRQGRRWTLKPRTWVQLGWTLRPLSPSNGRAFSAPPLCPERGNSRVRGCECIRERYDQSPIWIRFLQCVPGIGTLALEAGKLYHDSLLSRWR